MAKINTSSHICKRCATDRYHRSERASFAQGEGQIGNSSLPSLSFFRVSAAEYGSVWPRNCDTDAYACQAHWNSDFNLYIVDSAREELCVWVAFEACRSFQLIKQPLPGFPSRLAE